MTDEETEALADRVANKVAERLMPLIKDLIAVVDRVFDLVEDQCDCAVCLDARASEPVFDISDIMNIISWSKSKKEAPFD